MACHISLGLQMQHISSTWQNMFVSRQSPHFFRTFICSMLVDGCVKMRRFWTKFCVSPLLMSVSQCFTLKNCTVIRLLFWKVCEVSSSVYEVSQLITLATAWKSREKVYGLLQFTFTNFPFCNSSVSYLSFRRRSHKSRKEILQCWFPQPSIVGLMQVLLIHTF